MSESKYADDDLSELVQAAFDKYILDKLPAMIEKHLPLVDQMITERVRGIGYTPELNREYFARVEEMVKTTVGNYLRVGGGRDIIDTVISKYLDSKLQEHIEQQVKVRVNRIMETLRKNFEATLGVPAQGDVKR